MKMMKMMEIIEIIKEVSSVCQPRTSRSTNWVSGCLVDY
jgi:hypothetical protein